MNFTIQGSISRFVFLSFGLAAVMVFSLLLHPQEARAADYTDIVMTSFSGTDYSDGSHTYVCIPTTSEIPSWSGSQDWQMWLRNASDDSNQAPFNGYVGDAGRSPTCENNGGGANAFGFGKINMWDSGSAPTGDYYIYFEQPWTGSPEDTYRSQNFHWDASTLNATVAAAIPAYTHIEAIDPTDNQTIATSSLPYNFNTTGYVEAADYETGTRLAIKVDRNSDQQLTSAASAWDSAFGNWTYIPITADGEFDLSTTSINNIFGIDRIGVYTMTQKIQIPDLSVFGFNLTYTDFDPHYTKFVVATSTAIDIIVQNQTDYLQGVVDSGGSSLGACTFNWFEAAVNLSIGGDLLNCIGGIGVWLVVPQSSQLFGFQSLSEQMRLKIPFSYWYDLRTQLDALEVASSSTAFTADFSFLGAGASETTPIISFEGIPETERDNFFDTTKGTFTALIWVGEFVGYIILRTRTLIQIT